MRIFRPSFVSFWLILWPFSTAIAIPIESDRTSSIQYTGIASLDLLVRDLRLLDQELAQLESDIQNAESQIKHALDAPENMALEDAMAAFQQREKRAIRIIWVDQTIEAEPVENGDEIITRRADSLNQSIMSLYATKEKLAEIPNRFSVLQPEIDRVRTSAAEAGREALLNTRQRIDLIDQIHHNEAIAANFSPRATAGVGHANLILYYLQNVAQ